jgi:hypothetical protein
MKWKMYLVMIGQEDGSRKYQCISGYYSVDRCQERYLYTVLSCYSECKATPAFFPMIKSEKKVVFFWQNWICHIVLWFVSKRMRYCHPGSKSEQSFSHCRENVTSNTVLLYDKAALRSGHSSEKLFCLRLFTMRWRNQLTLLAGRWLGFLFDPNGGCIIFLRNYGEILSDYMTSHPRRQ